MGRTPVVQVGVADPYKVTALKNQELEATLYQGWGCDWCFGTVRARTMRLVLWCDQGTQHGVQRWDMCRKQGYSIAEHGTVCRED